MPKQISESELEAIRQAVGAFPAGALIEDISNALGHGFNRRTLQRRLALLVDRNQLVLEGSARASRYKLPPITTTAEIQLRSLIATAQGEVYVPTSEKGENIKQAVRRPVQERKPIGYNRGFVAAYQPNQTFYLPKQVRRPVCVGL